MSKKKKGAPALTPAPMPARQPVPAPSRTDITTKQAEVSAPRPSFELIRFDKKVKWFMGVCMGLFILLTLSKIHYSSIPIWNNIIPDGTSPTRGLVAGKPLSIRMDEYAVTTPFMLSQVNRGLPTQNFTVGGEKAPLFMYLPTKHFISFFRPDCWGFFFLDSERAYAWWWNMRIFLPLVLSVLIFLLLTQNNFWLSVFGGLWVMLSSGMVWWSFYSSLTIGYAFGLFIVGAYIVYADSRRTLLPLTLLFALLGLCFGLAIYPPTQVPCTYFILFLFGGYILKTWNRERALNQFVFKLAGFVGAFALIGLVAYLYYADAKSTLDIMSSTVYPGQRSETGGTGFIANYFSEYYSWWLDDANFPKKWLNICELSHSITFAPVIVLSLTGYFALTKNFDWMLLLLSVYIALTLIWIEVGFPESLVRLTLMNVSPTRRTQVPFGVANVFLTVLYVNYMKDRFVQVKPIFTWLVAALIIAFMIFVSAKTQTNSENFFKFNQLFISGALFAGLSILLLFTIRFPYKSLVFCGVILAYLLPHLRANPISKGLTPITQNGLYLNIQDVKQRDPNARWVVIGNQFISYLVAATGVDLLSGVKNTPDFATMRVLDPTAKRDSAYNRYAHTVYASFINGRDSVVIQNTFEDGYNVYLDPCSPKLKALNVKYFVFDKTPQPVEVRCMKQIIKSGSLEIYQRTD